MSRRNTMRKELTRRELFRRATCAAFATAAVASTVRDLRLVNAAVADGLPAPATDYKALVCIFLGGGNDCNNLLIPIEDPRPDIRSMRQCEAWLRPAVGVYARQYAYQSHQRRPHLWRPSKLSAIGEFVQLRQTGVCLQCRTPAFSDQSNAIQSQEHAVSAPAFFT